MNIEQARTNMVKQQLRTGGVVDDRLLKIINKTPRENFVLPGYADLAYADTALPIGHGEFMLCPTEEAQILQALDIQPHERVLEIGTGTGYFTALLAQLAQQVVSVDIFSDFMTPAAGRFAQLGLSNTTFTSGNAAEGWDTHAPYDIIVITGSLPVLPPRFLEQLKLGGRLFGILGLAPAMEATMLTYEKPGQIRSQFLFETVVAPLRDLAATNRFQF